MIFALVPHGLWRQAMPSSKYKQFNTLTTCTKPQNITKITLYNYAILHSFVRYLIATEKSCSKALTPYLNMRTILLLVLWLSPIAFIFQANNASGQSNNGSGKKEESTVYLLVEEMPVFQYKNCTSTNSSFLLYATDNIKPPKIECFGKIYIEFVVEPDSTISRVCVVKGLDECPDYKRTIEKRIASMPKWSPGKQRGVAVPVKMIMTIDIDPNTK